MIICKSQYQRFLSEEWSKDEVRKNLRLGQAFFNWANLHKMQQTPWLDKLYNADNLMAEAMILDKLDWEN